MLYRSKCPPQSLFLLILVGLTSVLLSTEKTTVMAQIPTSKGTAGFFSGAGSTTTSNTIFSLPASKGTAGFSSGIVNTTTIYSVPTFGQDKVYSILTLGKDRQPAAGLLTKLPPSIEEELNIMARGMPQQRALLNTVRARRALLNTVRARPNLILLERANVPAFQNYLGLPNSQPISLQETVTFLTQLAQIREVKPALIYIFSGNTPPVTGANTTPNQRQLQLLIVTQDGALPIIPVTGASPLEITKTLRQLEQNLSGGARNNDYLISSVKLYEWLIKPILPALQKQNINNLTFVLSDGLRTLPLAALYNSQTNRFLVEDYSLGLMPSLSLIDLTIQPRIPISNAKILAMGADTFPDQNPLPAVPLELSEITEQSSRGNIFLNQNFTVENLKNGIASQEFSLVHLATHGVFQPGDRRNSYIYLGDQKLNLEEFSRLGLDNPKIDLLVLSACKTAFGDPNAELGFAGLAVKTGARTALGSLWNVSDHGTLALMSLLYENLKTNQIKAESLRQAQIAILRGNYQIVNNQLILDNKISLNLTPELLTLFTNTDLRHPYYWSAFTLIGNPW